jgi:hypothetical protein
MIYFNLKLYKKNEINVSALEKILNFKFKALLNFIMNYKKKFKSNFEN